MCSDLVALPASRLGGKLKVSFARNALTCHSLTPTMIAHSRAGFFDRPNHLALPHRREAGRRRHGCCLQGGGYQSPSFRCPDKIVAMIRAVSPASRLLK